MDMNKHYNYIDTTLKIDDFEAGYLIDIMISNNFDSINDAFRYLLHEYIGDCTPTDLNFIDWINL